MPGRFLLQLILTCGVLAGLCGLIWMAIRQWGRQQNRSSAVPNTCPVCQKQLKLDAHDCANCGWAKDLASGQLARDVPLRITLHTLRRANIAGLIDDATMRSVAEAVRAAVRGPAAFANPPAATSQTAIGRPSTGTGKGADPDPDPDSSATPAILPLEAELVSDSRIADSADRNIAAARGTRQVEGQQPGFEPTRPLRPEQDESHQPIDVSSRVRQYQARREAARRASESPPADSGPAGERVGGAADILEASGSPALFPPRGAVASSLPPTKPLSEWLAAFMHERNIRWGELVGGLLIISCSLALVVSFWEHISTRPWLKFGIFTGVTAGLFAVGLRASHRWKLPTTGQGVLMIAMMLVPLNFLGLASFTANTQVNVVTIVGEFLSLAIFALLGYHASRQLTPSFPWLTTPIVLTLAFGNIAIRRFVGQQPSWQSLYAVSLPLYACYASTIVGLRQFVRLSGTAAAPELGMPPSVYGADERSPAGPTSLPSVLRAVNELWKLLALATFAFVLLMGFLVSRTETMRGTLQTLAPLLLLAGLPAITIGSVLWQAARQRADGRWYLLPASGVALSGGLLMFAAVVLAWPHPLLLIMTLAVCGGSIVVLAESWRVPSVHFVGLAAFALTVPLAALVLRGQLPFDESSGNVVIRLLESVATGFSLLGFGGVLLIAAEVWHRFQRNDCRHVYMLGGACSGLAGTALITLFGFGRAEYAASVGATYVAYACISYLTSLHTRRLFWQWISAAVTMAAGLQILYFGRLTDHPPSNRLFVTFVAAGAVYVSVAMIEAWRRTTRLSPDGAPAPGSDPVDATLPSSARAVAMPAASEPFEWMALTTIAVASATVVAGGLAGVRPPTGSLGGLAMLWLIGAWRHQRRELFAAGQIVLLGTLGLAIDDRLSGSDWYAGIRFGWLHPYSVQCQAAGLGAFGFAWLLARAAVRSAMLQAAACPPPETETGRLTAGHVSVSTALAAREPRTILSRATKLVSAESFSVDRIAVALAVILLAGLAIYSVVPGMLQELLPRDAVASLDSVRSGSAAEGFLRQIPAAEQFEWFGVPHVPAASLGSWYLLGFLALVTAAGFLEQRRTATLALAATVLSLSVYFLAARWEGQVAVASALRWNLSLLFLAANIALWLWRPNGFPWLWFARFTRQSKSPDESGLPDDVFVASRSLAGSWFAIACWHAVLPLVAMLVCVAAAAWRLEPPSAHDQRILQWLLAVCIAGCSVLVIQLHLSRIGTSPERHAAASETYSSGSGWQQLTMSAALLSIMPVVAMTLYVVGQSLARHPITGPDSHSFFVRIGLAGNYATPMFFVATALVGTAIYLRSQSIALAGGLMLNLCGTAAYLLTLGKSGLGVAQWLELAQGNSLIASLFGSGWAVLRWWSPADARCPAKTSDRYAEESVVADGEKSWKTSSGKRPADRSLLSSPSLQIRSARNTADDRLHTQFNLAAGFLASAVVAVYLLALLDPRGTPAVYDFASGIGWSSLVALAGLSCLMHCAGRSNIDSYLPLLVGSGAILAAGRANAVGNPWDGPYALLVCWNIATLLLVCRMLQRRWQLLWSGDFAPLATAVAGDSAGIAGDSHGGDGGGSFSTQGRRDRAGTHPGLRLWLDVGIVATSLFALRLLESPQAPWPTVVGLVAAAIWSSASGWLEARRRSLGLAVGLLQLAALLVWGRAAGQGANFTLLFDLAYHQVVAAAAPVGIWIAIGLHWKRRSDVIHRSLATLPLPRVATLVCVGVMAVTATAGFVAGLGGINISPPHDLLMWLAIATTALAVWSCHWDLQVRWQAVGLHVVGFAATLCLLNSLHLRSDPLTWSAPLFLAAYSLASSYLISRREGLGAALRQLRLLPAAATAPASEPLGLILSNSVLAGGIVMLAFGAQFRCNVGAFRLAAAQSIFAQALALGLLATSSARTRAADRRGGEGPATGWKDGAAPTGAREEASSNAASISERLRFAALALAVLGVIAFGWSFLMPDKPWLFERLTITAVAVSAMSMCYGFGLVKLVRRPGIWSETARRMMPTLLFLSTLVVGIALAVEVTAHVTRGGSPEFLATVGIAATLGVACVASLVAALAPGRDPWGLSAHYRPAYVYAAEIILLMLVVHFRVAMPWLFSGLLQQIWPLLVMAIAFCGIGLSEWAERRQIDVLSKPLGKTGALLPLLPALGFWMLPSHIHYSFLMVVVGATYGVLAYLRRSTGFALLAIIAVNGGLWYLLDQNAIEFLKHPQVWLIPPAICALAAAHWNRDRLGHEQIEAVRYGASMVIYVASTSEVFVQGIAQAPWLPLVLAGLSLIGIAAGIAWQVRAFLWLGTCFLLVALFSMIWYAAVDLGWTWLWYVSGIVAGVMILGIFAWLEKKRIRAAE